jgi:zinc D-Ala-D-Ala dipeptidase
MADKISKQNLFQIIACIIFSTSILACEAQRDSALIVVSKYKQYKELVSKDPSKKMVELKSVAPNLVYDLRYSTLNNFMHRKLYKQGEETFLRSPVADALAKAQRELNEKGLGLKIWDAYRPYSVTVKMWEPIKDERYVADPKKGSGHNRGGAVDLTIINLKNGNELNMGTGFDNFSDTAHSTFTNLPEEILQNRLLLKTTMEKYGFINLQTEWWHFYWKELSRFEVMDIDFKKFTSPSNSLSKGEGEHESPVTAFLLH